MCSVSSDEDRNPSPPPDRDISANLVMYQQTIDHSFPAATVHQSSNSVVSMYNGTWTRGLTIGTGQFAEVYISNNSAGPQQRAVKEISRGRSDWIDREIECLAVLRNVSLSLVDH